MKLKNLLLLTLCSAPMMHAVVLTNLAANTSAKVFDRAFGTLYLGLAGGGNNALTAFYRFDGSGTPSSSAIATNAALTGSTIEFLALSEQGCDTPTLLAAVTLLTNDFSQTKVTALNNTGSTVTTSLDLNDATGAAVTAGIVGLAASNNYIFAAVRPNGANFGAAHSGIALIKLDPATVALTVQNAVAGGNGNVAQTFDLDSPTLGISTAVIFDTPDNTNISLHYDSFLQRLYLATRITAGADGARSVAVAYVDNAGSLQINKIAPNGAFNALNDQIIGTTNATTVHAYQVGVLHASTGPSYLIVNGNADITTNHANSIYALPLVDNPSVPADHGTLARKDAALTNGTFTVPATLPAHLATIAEDAAKVGTGPLPIPNDNIPWEIVVVGDTVYASIDDPFSANSESGIFYSQALFDETGKIARWTPWSKRATPFNSFPDSTATLHPQVSFFDVDAMNGKLWAVGAALVGTDVLPTATLITTAWDTGSTTKSLAGALNANMTTGCYSILDLDQSTRGFEPATGCRTRYALFGGVDKVIFARVSQAAAGSPYPQTVTTDYSGAADFLSSPLPSGAGAVVALEYSRRVVGEGAQNYFFAGAQGGLYVFADATGAGAGFTSAAAVNALNATPFSTGKWYQIDTDLIEGSVIALKTTGEGVGALYILTLEATTNPTSPIISRLYRMLLDTTFDTMNAISHIALLAQSQTAALNSDLTNAKIIVGMQNITIAGPTEQLVIATNNGLYRSTRAGANGILAATDQADALWTPVDPTDTALYTGLFGIDNAQFQSTMWAVQTADEAGAKTFERSNIRQLSGMVTANGYTFIPNPFNSSDITAANATTLPQATFFWSDGNRRFFVMKRTGDSAGRNRLMVFPYDQDEWCASTIYVLDPVMSNICSCNCIKQIGATGILMVGTDSGVVALE